MRMMSREWSWTSPALLYFKLLLTNKRQSGQGLAEYGLIISLIVLVAVVGVTGLGDVGLSMYNGINDQVIPALGG